MIVDMIYRHTTICSIYFAGSNMLHDSEQIIYWM